MEKTTNETVEQAPAKKEESLPTHDPIWLNTTRGAVTVYGHKLISKRTLNIIGACLNLPEFEEADHGLYEIVFSEEEILDTEDNKVYAMFYPDPKAIVVSLPRIWDNAIEEALSEEKNISVVCAIHHNLLFHIFHDIHHAASNAAGVDIFDETENEEEKASDWANDKIIELAKIVDIEPVWQDEPWFSPLIKELFLNMDTEEVVVNAKNFSEDTTPGKEDKKALVAKEMIEKNILILDKEEGKDDLIITSFREFIKLLSDDPEGWNDKVLTKNFLNKPTSEPQIQVSAEMTSTLMEMEDDVPWVENEGVMFGGGEIKTTDHPEMQVATAFGGKPVTTNQPLPAKPTDPFTTFAAQAFPTTPESNVILPGTEDFAKIIQKVYMTCYQHIFTNCVLQVNSDIAFQNPQFVLSNPVDLNAIPGAKEIIIGADINDPQTGVYQSKVPIANGLLFGNLKKNTQLPGYTLHINVNGEYSTRALIPQNPATGSSTAIRAKAGNAIMWIIDGSKARDDGARWKYKIENGVVTPCQQFNASA